MMLSRVVATPVPGTGQTGADQTLTNGMPRANGDENPDCGDESPAPPEKPTASKKVTELATAAVSGRRQKISMKTAH